MSSSFPPIDVAAATPSDRALDATVEYTFPASDPGEGTPTLGAQVDLDVLRNAPTARTALRLLLVAGLQALEQVERVAAEGLPGAASLAEDAGLRAWLEGLIGASEARLLRLSQSLASFGQAAHPRLTTLVPAMMAEFVTAIGSEAAGPARDCAIAVQASLAVRGKLAEYEAVSALAHAMDAADATRLLGENLAETRLAVEEADRILARTAATMPARPALSAETSFLVFGAHR